MLLKELVAMVEALESMKAPRKVGFLLKQDVNKWQKQLQLDLASVANLSNNSKNTKHK